MTIKGIFRVQTRSDLPDTPRGVPHGKGIRPSRARHFGSPGKATGLHLEAASSTWDSTFASMSTDRLRPTCRPQRVSIVIGSSGFEEADRSMAALQACRVVASGTM